MADPVPRVLPLLALCLLLAACSEAPEEAVTESEGESQTTEAVRIYTALDVPAAAHGDQNGIGRQPLILPLSVVPGQVMSARPGQSLTA